MGEKVYLLYLDQALQNRYRYWHRWERGKIVEFCVQYEALIADRWRPVVRYDSAHGEPHRDTLHPDGTETKSSYRGYANNEVLTVGCQDIVTNWRKYRTRYEKEMR
jgi:hypothetical protein